MKNKQVLLSLCLSAIAFISSFPAQSCIFDTQPYFTYSVHPDLPLNSYASGQLGILQPTYARSYLFVAYRYLANQPLSKSEQDVAINLWNKRLTTTDISCSNDTSLWLKARSAVPNVTKLDSIITERPINEKEPWESYCNCQSSAFNTAAKTLNSLINQFGLSSPSVKDWTAAQDKVFSNCGYPPYQTESKPSEIPEPLPASVDQLLQKERAYQIAAANFYAQNFEVAREQFDRIAADNDSPWKQIAAYLAVRALIRSATLGASNTKDKLIDAQQRLKQLQATSTDPYLKSDLAELSDFVEARLNPEKYLHQLLESSPISIDNLGEITFTIDSIIDSSSQQSSGDSTPQHLPASFNNIEAVDWVMNFQDTSDKAKSYAIGKWKQTKSLPWLVSAICSVNPDDPNANALVAAVDAYPQTAPIYWTLFYYANRIKIAKGNENDVRKELDKVISNPPSSLPIGALNQLRTQRLKLAQSLNEFVKFGIQTPQTIASNAAVSEVPDDIERIVKNEPLKEKPPGPEFIAVAGEALDNQMPLSVLTALARNSEMPADLHNNIAWTSWVRAVLINDNAAAYQLAIITKQLNKKKQPFFDTYLSAANPDMQKFAAAFLMLHFSSATPNASWGPLSEDAYGDASNWWWAEKPVAGAFQIGLGDADTNTIKPIDFQFMTNDQKTQAKKELEQLAKVPAAPNYFASIVLSFAKAHPNDARVPEALHWFVKSTRYGVTTDATKAYSKEAFALLHSKYKTSPWTTKTPYYY